MNIKLELEVQELDLIMRLVTTAPWSQVNAVICKIQTQANDPKLQLGVKHGTEPNSTPDA